MLAGIGVPMLAAGQSASTVQVLADFTAPDSVCAKTPVTITNLTQGGTTFNWAFATGSLDDEPREESFGNVLGILKQPKYITMVRDGDAFYSFITDAGTGDVVRNYHGTQLINHPLTTVRLVNIDPQINRIRGIQIRNDNGHWYGYVVREYMLVRLDFQSSISNTPVPTDVEMFGNLVMGDGLELVKEGNEWLGFCTDSAANRLVRFRFGTTLGNLPTASLVNLPAGVLVHPGQFVMARENDNWYMFVCNSGENTISRLEFGSSLLNQPTGVNLGNVGSLEKVSGITITKDCDRYTGYVINKRFYSNVLTRIDFPQGLAGPVAGNLATNSGTLVNPEKMSEMVRNGDTLYNFITNSLNASLSLIFFPGSGEVTPSGSTLRDPPPVTYKNPGTYTIMLVVDEGQPTMQVVCKKIVVVEGANVDLGPDRTICNGQSAMLDAGAGFSVYAWNTGDTTRTITVSQAGIYGVSVENAFGCADSDSLAVFENQAVTNTVDTSICAGERYYASKAWQTASGTYYDTLQNVYGCDSIVTTQLQVKAPVVVYLGHDTLICSPDTIVLHARVPGAVFTWQDGSHDSLFTVTGSGLYWVDAALDRCHGSDSIRISGCPGEVARLWMPNAFTPNGDGLNDVFRPVAVNIAKFHMQIFDRWGRMVFETQDLSAGWSGIEGNSYFPSATYTYKVEYESALTPGETQRLQGVVSLVR
jgi:gliding motility-associated-like protein